MSKKENGTEPSSNDQNLASSSLESGTEKKDARRKVLRNTLIGGAVISAAAVPTKWRKPVLEAVVLPAHAATTEDDDTGSGGPDLPVTTTGLPVTTTTGLPVTTTTGLPVTTTTGRPGNVFANFSFSDWTKPVA